MKPLAVLVIVLVLVGLVTAVVYGVRAILNSRTAWAIADARWEVDVIPGRDQTDVILQEVARIGKKTKVLHSQLFRSVDRNDPHHAIEVQIAKEEAQAYVDGTLQ